MNSSNPELSHLTPLPIDPTISSCSVPPNSIPSSLIPTILPPSHLLPLNSSSSYLLPIIYYPNHQTTSQPSKSIVPLSKPKTNLISLPDEALQRVCKTICTDYKETVHGVPPTLVALASTCRRLRHQALYFMAQFKPYSTSSQWCVANSQYITNFQHPIPKSIGRDNQVHVSQYSPEAASTCFLNPDEMPINKNGMTTKDLYHLKVLEEMLMKSDIPPPIHTLDLGLQASETISKNIQRNLHRIAPTLRRFRLKCSIAKIPKMIPFDKFDLKELTLTISICSSVGWSSVIRALRAIPATCLRLIVSGQPLGKLPCNLLIPVLQSVKRLDLIYGRTAQQRSCTIPVPLNVYSKFISLCSSLEILSLDGFSITDEDVDLLIKQNECFSLHAIELRRMTTKGLENAMNTKLKPIITVIECLGVETKPNIINSLQPSLTGLSLWVSLESMLALQKKFRSFTSLKALRLEIVSVAWNMYSLKVVMDLIKEVSHSLEELRITAHCPIDMFIPILRTYGPKLNVLGFRSPPYFGYYDYINLADMGYSVLNNHHQIVSDKCSDTRSISTIRSEETDKSNIYWVRNFELS